MPYDIPGGRYWTAYELNNRLGGSRVRTLKKVLDSNPEVLKVGQTFLVPEKIVAKVLEDATPVCNSSLSIARAADITRASYALVETILNSGFPYITTENGAKRINREDIPYLANAIEYFRDLDGRLYSNRAADIAQMAITRQAENQKTK